MASAPAATAVRASATLEMQQILTRVRMGFVGVSGSAAAGRARVPIRWRGQAAARSPRARLSLGMTSSAMSRMEFNWCALWVSFRQSVAVMRTVPKGPTSSRSARIWSATESGSPAMEKASQA